MHNSVYSMNMKMNKPQEPLLVSGLNMKMKKPQEPLPVSGVNHVTLLCSCLERSVAFYQNILGFLPIKRPHSLHDHGAWLFNYGMGIHLIEATNPNQIVKKTDINPSDSHISFQTKCHDIDEVQNRLEELGVQHKRVSVQEGNIIVDQIFFHDPDGFMIEVCTCDNFPLVPLKSFSGIKPKELQEDLHFDTEVNLCTISCGKEMNISSLS